MIFFKKKRKQTAKEEFWEALNRSREEREKAEAKFERELAENRAEWEARHAKFERELTESHAKFERELAESHAKFERELAESRAEWEARLKKQDKNIGRISSSVGAFAEDFFASKSAELLYSYGYTFKRVFQRTPVYDKSKRTLTDIDLMLSNGEYGMAIEVKTHLTYDDVNVMNNNMPVIKLNPPAEIAGKKLLCAVAGINVEDDARKRAFELGMFVFEQSDDTITLTEPPEGFKAAEW